MASFNSTQSNSSFSSFERRLNLGEITREVESILEEDIITNNEERIKKLESIIHKVEAEAPTNNASDSNTGECYIHSKLLKDTSSLAIRCTEHVTGEVNNYDKLELAQHIADNPEFWEFTFPNEVPAVSYLSGTFEPTPPEERPKVQRPRVQRQRAQKADLKAPETLQQSRKKDQCTKMVDKIQRFVKETCRSGPVSYFHIVLDPTCFSRTIENIYYVSYLVKEGLVAVNLDENIGLPLIAPVSEEKKRKPEDMTENQFILSMDMHRWKELIAAFDIRKPMMNFKRT